MKLVQEGSLTVDNKKKLSTLDTILDKNGLIRLKTRICNKKYSNCFLFPIVLPLKHAVVKRLIFEYHIRSCHVGIQSLMSVIREKYWILGDRRTLRSVLSECVVYRRHQAKAFSVASPPLPLDRVRDADVFEVSGMDFAGPLYLKNGEKAWICLFTCAIYRVVHLELVSSLSTPHFMQAFR